MGDQRELFGPVASVPTAWRALAEIAAGGDSRRRKVAAAVSRARRHACARHRAARRPAPGPGRGPQARGRDLHPAGCHRRDRAQTRNWQSRTSKATATTRSSQPAINTVTIGRAFRALTTEADLLPSLMDAGDDLPPEERALVLRRTD
jgi:hypothetical protein